MIKSFSHCDFTAQLNVVVVSLTKDPTHYVSEAPGKGEARVPAHNHQNA